jgi:RimK family alpha-L-glutamate ligase
MKKILIISVKESSHRTNRIINELEKINCPYEFIKWKSTFFYNDEIFSDQKKINLKNFCSVFFDIPRYELIVNKKEGKEFSFNLSNELFIFLSLCRDLNIKVVNRDFILAHPHYNKFTLSQSYFSKKISAVPTFHFSDNKFEYVYQTLKKNGLKFPLIAKQSDGSMGEQVWKIKKISELQELTNEKRSSNLVFQPYIKNKSDFRVLVVSGRSLGIMERKAKKGEWKNNYSLGGEISKFTDKKMELFAEKVAKKMNLDYVGLDLFKSEGTYLIIEINIFASFEGFEKAFPEVNVAKKIVNFLLK